MCKAFCWWASDVLPACCVYLTLPIWKVNTRSRRYLCFLFSRIRYTEVIGQCCIHWLIAHKWKSKELFHIEDTVFINLPNIQLMKLHIFHRLLKETLMKERTREPAVDVTSVGSHEVFGVEVDITSMQKIPFFSRRNLISPTTVPIFVSANQSDCHF